jgi:hypothetical protein
MPAAAGGRPRREISPTSSKAPMPIAGQKITPCLWFDSQAEEAANFYVSIFKNSRIGRVSRYGKEGSRFTAGRRDR